MSDEGRPIRDDDYSKISLWFFRDISTDQRMKLFRLLGWPVEEMDTHASQMFALKSALGKTPIVKAAPEVKRTHSA